MTEDTHIPRRGDLYIIEQRTKDEKRSWKWFGVVNSVKPRFMNLYRLGDFPKFVTLPTPANPIWQDQYPSITYIPDDQWPDGCVVLKMKAVLEGTLPEDLI